MDDPRIHAGEVLELGVTRYGIPLACGASDGVPGGLIVPEIARRLGMRTSLVLAPGAFVLPHPVLGLFSSVVLISLAILIEAGKVMLWNDVALSHPRRLIPDELLGGVNFVYLFFAWGSIPLAPRLRAPWSPSLR